MILYIAPLIVCICYDLLRFFLAELFLLSRLLMHNFEIYLYLSIVKITNSLYLANYIETNIARPYMTFFFEHAIDCQSNICE